MIEKTIFHSGRVRCAYRFLLLYFRQKVRAAYPTRLINILGVFSLTLAALVLNVDVTYGANEKLPAEATVKTISLWMHFEAAIGERAVLDASAARYNAGRHGYRIEIQSFDKAVYDGQVNKAAANGELPCLLDADGPYLYTLAWRGYLQPIEQWLPKSLLDD